MACPSRTACRGPGDVAIEFDDDPRRQDIDYELARRAVKAGCIFALDSNAHAADEWHLSRPRLPMPRLAQIPSEHVINCWRSTSC
jgi:histidinol phosphatase-like PHP family hydrolase